MKVYGIPLSFVLIFFSVDGIIGSLKGYDNKYGRKDVQVFCFIGGQYDWRSLSCLVWIWVNVLDQSGRYKQVLSFNKLPVMSRVRDVGHISNYV